MQASSLVAPCLWQELFKRVQHVDVLPPTRTSPPAGASADGWSTGLVTFLFPTLADTGGRSGEALPLAWTDAGQHAAAEPGPSQ